MSAATIPEPNAGQVTAPAPEPETGQQSAGPRPRRKPGIEARIGQLIAQRTAAENRVLELEQRVADLEAENAQLRSRPAPLTPDPEMLEQAVQNRLRLERFRERAMAFRRTHPDFDEVTANDVQLPGAVVIQVQEFENGPEVFYFLAMHPELCELLRQMPWPEALRRVCKISVDLEARRGV